MFCYRIVQHEGIGGLHIDTFCRHFLKLSALGGLYFTSDEYFTIVNVAGADCVQVFPSKDIKQWCAVLCETD